ERISQLYVEFSTKGLPELQRALEGIKALAEGLGRQFEQSGLKITTTVNNWGRGLQDLGALGGRVFGALAGYVGGFVRQGIAPSAAGEFLGLQRQQLSLQIASLFVPQIQAVQQGLVRVIQWFRSLTGEQQASIRQWLLWTAGAAAGLMLLP